MNDIAVRFLLFILIILVIVQGHWKIYYSTTQGTWNGSKSYAVDSAPYIFY